MNVVMIVGFPGSGKSSYVEAYECKGYVRLNRDTVGGNTAGLVPKLDELLSQGKDVVLDNTQDNMSNGYAVPTPETLRRCMIKE